MALVTLTSRVEEADKASFEDFCSAVGLTVSTAVNMYVKVVVRDRKLPFEISQEEPLDDPFYSKTNQAHLMKAIQQLKEGRGVAHELIEV
mgnify:FL=1